MKKGIHPELSPAVFIDASSGDEIITRTTLRGAETRDIDGVTHLVFKSDITSYSHPFYTGTQRVLDAEGRVDRFKRKYGRK